MPKTAPPSPPRPPAASPTTPPPSTPPNATGNHSPSAAKPATSPPPSEHLPRPPPRASLPRPLLQFPGCDNTRFLHAHHLHHWARGGDTSLDNVILLCGPHHRLLHEHGYRAERRPQGQLSFHHPWG